jgi:hypothetical protein
LPSVIAYIDEQNKPQYKTFLADEYYREVQIDSVCAGNINEIWNSSWRRLPPIPDRTAFVIDTKYRDDPNKKIMSKELREELERELAWHGAQLSLMADRSGRFLVRNPEARQGLFKFRGSHKRQS